MDIINSKYKQFLKPYTYEKNLHFTQDYFYNFPFN